MGAVRFVGDRVLPSSRVRNAVARIDVLPYMNNEIRHLIEQGILKVAPVRARSAADIPRVRAALAKKH
jgi:hypothetical protein